MTDAVFNLRYLEESQPSICIPRVFNNIDAIVNGLMLHARLAAKSKFLNIIHRGSNAGHR